MPELIRHWAIGPPRATTWRRGLPLPGHRNMAQVLAGEQREAVERGATAFAPVREHEETDDAPRPRPL